MNRIQTAARSRIQTAARSAVAVGAVGVAVLGFAPTASATSSDTLTVAGASTYTYTTNQSPQIQGVAQPNCSGSPAKVALTLTGPGVVSPILASATPDCSNALTIQPTDDAVNTAHPEWAGGIPAENGNYTVTLNNEGRTTQAKFTLLIPPAKTTGFTVAASSTNATFKWTANPEPDVVGYVIKDAAGNTVASPTKACTGTKCSDGPVSLGSTVAGQTEKFAIFAVRSCGDAACSYGVVPGTTPATASATFSAPSSSPTPTPTKSSSGGKGGSGTGSLSGGGTKTGSSGKTGSLSDPGGKKALHHKSKKGSSLPSFSGSTLPSIDLPSLPAGTTTSVGGASSNGEPTTLGKPGGNLTYPAPQVATKKKVTVASGGGISHEISVAVNKKPLWRGIGAAAVLLLIAVHLRAWAGREDYL